MKTIVSMLMFLALLPMVSATILEGNVYDFSLTKVDKAIVEINTSPLQRAVTENGTYSFDLAGGDYVITAKSLRQGMITAQASENIVLPKEGIFMLDLILFPELMEDVELPEEPQTEYTEIFEKPQNEYFFVYRALIIIAIALAAWFGYQWYQKRNTQQHAKKESAPSAPTATSAEGELEQVLSIIKKNEGRITQKDLRKELPYSEAKVSLILDELESQGKLKKIKKGRGNIIVLK